MFCIRGHSQGVGDADSLWLPHEPTLYELTQAFDARPDLHEVSEIVFCGYGEPLERAELVVALAQHIRMRSNKPLRLNTNGLVGLIEPGFDTKKLKLFDTISVSLNADTKKGYVEVTRPVFGEKSFDEMLEFAKKMNKLTKVQFTIVETLPKESQAGCQRIADEMNIPLLVRTMM